MGRARFDLTDTGGLFGASEDPLHELVVERASARSKQADLIVFVVDGREGLIPGDQEIAAAVRAAGVPGHPGDQQDGRSPRPRRRARAVSNGLRSGGRDQRRAWAQASAICWKRSSRSCRAGPRSAGRSRDPGEPDESPRTLPDREQRTLSPRRSGDRDRRPAERGQVVAGQPAVARRADDRVRVPGTTRDSVDSLLTWHRRQFRIVDTAGIRKPGKVSKSGQVETLSVMLAKRAIERADVVVLVIDATVGPTDQDGAIAGAAKDAGRGIIIAANKWDLMKEQGPEAAKKFDENLRYQLKFLDFAPILHISAATGERTPKLLEMVDKVSAADAHARRRPASSIASSKRSRRARRRSRRAGATCA